MCPMSRVTCHLSPVTCYMSHVIFSFFLSLKIIGQSCVSKGCVKKRGRMKLLLMLLQWKIVFWQHQCIVKTKILNGYKKTLFINVKKIINIFAEKKEEKKEEKKYCVSRCSIEQTDFFFFDKMFYFFFFHINNFFYQLKFFNQKNALMLSPNGNFYCNALQNLHVFLFCWNFF